MLLYNITHQEPFLPAEHHAAVWALGKFGARVPTKMHPSRDIHTQPPFHLPNRSHLILPVARLNTFLPVNLKWTTMPKILLVVTSASKMGEKETGGLSRANNRQFCSQAGVMH